MYDAQTIKDSHRNIEDFTYQCTRRITEYLRRLFEAADRNSLRYINNCEMREARLDFDHDTESYRIIYTYGWHSSGSYETIEFTLDELAVSAEEWESYIQRKIQEALDGIKRKAEESEQAKILKEQKDREDRLALLKELKKEFGDV